jgi:hypothetical protein
VRVVNQLSKRKREKLMIELLVEHPYGAERKVFTAEGVSRLIELMTIGHVEVTFEGESIVLNVYDNTESISGILKVKFSNVVASTVDRIEQLADEDLHEARCELYGMAGLFREAADLAERAARNIDEHKWRDTYVPHFIRVGDEYEDSYLSNDEDEEESGEGDQEEKK